MTSPGKYGNTILFEEEVEDTPISSRGKYGKIVTDETSQEQKAPGIKEQFKEFFFQEEPTPFETGIAQGLRGLLPALLGLPGDIFSLAQKPGQSVGSYVTRQLGLQPQESFQVLPKTENIQQFIDAITGGEYIPKTQGEQLYQEAFGRLGRSLPSALLGPGALATALTSEAGGLSAKELIKGLGGGETSQTVADILAGLGSGTAQSMISRRSGIAPKGLEKLEAKGKEFGLTEKELTPLLQSEKKGRFFSKLARKSPKDQKMFEDIESKFGDAFSGIRDQASKLPPLNDSQETKLVNSFQAVVDDLKKTIKPSKDKEEVIKFMESSIDKVLLDGTNPEELINFYRDINQTVNWKAISGGKKKLAEFKNIIKDSLKEVDPKLSQEFEVSNELYSKFKQTEKFMKPEIYDKFLEMQKYIGIPTAIGDFLLTGNPSGLYAEGAIIGIREIARQALLNPKIQNLRKNFFRAIESNSPKLAKQIGKEVEKEINRDTR